MTGDRDSSVDARGGTLALSGSPSSRRRTDVFLVKTLLGIDRAVARASFR